MDGPDELTRSLPALNCCECVRVAGSWSQSCMCWAGATCRNSPHPELVAGAVSPGWLSHTWPPPFSSPSFKALTPRQARQLLLSHSPFWQLHVEASPQALPPRVSAPSGALGTLPCCISFPQADTVAPQSFPRHSCRVYPTLLLTPCFQTQQQSASCSLGSVSYVLT